MTIHKAVLAVEIIVLRELWKQAHTHSFCVTGTHAEANVLARHVQASSNSEHETPGLGCEQQPQM